MDPETYVGLGEGGPVTASDLEAALNRVLEQFRRPQAGAALEGANALELDAKVRPGFLHIRRLVARTVSGRRFAVEDEWLPLPPAGDEPAPVAVGLHWRRQPVADGAVVEWRAPRLESVSPGEPPPAEGALLLGTWAKNGFMEAPLWGDRLDCSRPLREWADRLRNRLRRADHLLCRVVGRLAADRPLALTWCALIQPTLARLAEALAALDDDEEPRRAVRRLRGWLAALAELPERANLIGGDDVVILLGRLDLSEALPAAESSEARQACADVEAGVAHALRALEMLARYTAAELAGRLPDVLYQGGRLYRRVPGAALDGWTMRLPPGSVPALAMLWDPKSRLPRLGEVKLTVDHAAASRKRPREVLLKGLDVGEFHWYPLDADARQVAVSVGPLPRLQDAALYEPMSAT